MPGEATILHADLDAFYASVEQRDDPRLRGRPVIVGMGVVLAASYEARACGVRTAMGGAEARRLCPQAIVVSPRMSAYSEASKAVFAVFEDTTPLVEGLSIDEAFLDVGGLRRVSGTPAEIAARLRREVRERVGLPITVGVARTKFLAKVASGVAKPDGLLVVPPDGELAFLHPLPVERLWGVGPVTAEKLRARGLERVGDVAMLREPALVAMLGVASGRHLHALAHNRDPRPVQVGRRRGSIGSQRAHRPRAAHGRRGGRHARAARRPGDPADAGRAAGRAAPWLCACGSTTSRAPPARTPWPAPPTTPPRSWPWRATFWPARSRSWSAAASRSWASPSPTSTATAPSSWCSPSTAPPAARSTPPLDDVRERFGSSAITRAVLLGRSEGLAVPLLPD